MTAFQRISGISEVDIDMFCDGERSHMKENIVTVVCRFTCYIYLYI